jgi:hypothetical protein
MTQLPDSNIKPAAEAPIWQRAHSTLNDIRNGLMQYREDLEKRGEAVRHEIVEVDNALARIQPPVPSPMPGMTNSASSNYAVPAPGRWS